jgi:hypothetical protein
MRPYGDDVVNVRAQFRGYSDAVSRFSEAAAGRDPIAAYLPLFEALNWAVALDDRISEVWAPEGVALGFAWRERVRGAEALAGLRYARNTVHHDWADSLRLDTSGRRYPRRYPVRYFEWVWRDIAELPPTDKTHGNDVYRELLAGQAAEHTLTTLGEAFDFVSELVEPPVPSSAG